MDYKEYIENKGHYSGNSGFDPLYIPDKMFEFQKFLLRWSVNMGRSAVFADCGLGKSFIELAYAENIVRKTGGNVLLLTPLAVGAQMVNEAEKFGINATRSRDGIIHDKITITNYEQLHNFNPDDFTGVVCDESSILKNFQGKIKTQITGFMRKIKYRLLATATAAPNDWTELGTSSEALGYLRHMDMLDKFFHNTQNDCKTSYRNSRWGGNITNKWILKGHAVDPFWQWVASWAKAVNKPSDIGFKNDGYDLPELNVIDHELPLVGRKSNCLFDLPAVGLAEQREERKATINERCERAAEIANNCNDFCVVWCNLNAEGDLLEKLIPDAVQVSGRDNDDKKESKLMAFTNKNERVLITKPKIGAWGLNWQHCNNMTYFPTHSFEQFYQSVRRCWRFGQERKVNCNLIFTEGDKKVIENLRYKKTQSEEMFTRLVEFMNNPNEIKSKIRNFNKPILPEWLKGKK